MRKILALLLAITLSVTLFAACGGNTDTPSSGTPADSSGDTAQNDTQEEAPPPAASSGVTIRMAHHAAPGASEEADTLINNLNAIGEEMGFTIVHEGAPGDELRNKIRMDAAANNLPDLWKFWLGGVMADYVKAGNLQDIDDYLALSKKVSIDDYLPGAWIGATFEGIKYGIPFQQGIGIFMANSELFEQYGLDYPTTWDEFIAVGQVFRDNGIAPTNIGSMGGNPSHFFYGDIVCQYNDGPALSQNLADHLEFNNPVFRKAAHWIQDLRDNGMFPDDVMANGDWTPSTVMYLEGRAAMCYTFGWMFELFMTDAPEMIDKSVIIPIPPVPDAQRDTRTFIQGTENDSYVINSASWADSAKTDFIVAMMDYLNYDHEIIAMQNGWRVAVNQNVLRQIDLSTISNRLLAKVLEYRIANSVEGSPMIWQNCPDNKTQFDYQAFMDEFWAGAIDADEYVDKVQDSFDEFKESQ